MNTYYWVQGPDDNKVYFESSEEFLSFIKSQGDDENICGADELSDEEFALIQEDEEALDA